MDRDRYLALCDTLLAATRRLPHGDRQGVH
jgi:hypothetical protein